MDYFNRVERAALALEGVGTPDVAIVLGSGLGGFAETLSDAVTTPYAEIPHWPPSAVIGHAGTLVVGRMAGRRVAALAGRVHYYEGHDLRTVTFATRVLGRLGVKVLILTNAAGGINVSFEPGTLMAIDDHINLLGSNPLVGPNEDRFGVRFPDMTEVYSKRLRAAADAAAAARGIRLAHGIYAAVHGPSYETPAEIRYLRTIGADAVGMSTVPEAIVARHGGLEVLGLVIVANWAAGISPVPLSHAEVLEASQAVGDRLANLVEAVVLRLASEPTAPQTDFP